MTEIQSIKEFTESFFSSIKCEMKWDNKMLVVSNIPSAFEEYYGKKGPYYIVFDRSEEKDNTELMVKGSFLLKAMASFLESRGQTAMLKIDFDFEPKDLIKSKFTFPNSEIYSVLRKPLYTQLVRFTFLTTLQYLNEKEQVTNHIYIKDGKIIDFDVAKFRTTEGRKDEISVRDIKSDYSVAKDHLKALISPKIEKVGKELEEKLDSEIKRVRGHYSIQLKELEDELNKNISQLKELELSQEMPTEASNNKMKRLKDTIEKIQMSNKSEQLEKEMEFFINDETHKHSLNVDNKLISTSIIYYPDFILQLYVKNNDTGRQIEIPFKPISHEIGKIACESCNSEITDIIVCSSGHLTCRRCLDACGDCLKSLCKKCSVKLCDHCGKKMCRKCNERCSGCSRHVCSSHRGKDSISNAVGCMNCLHSCNKCSQKFFKTKLKKVGPYDVCEKCIRLSAVKR